MKKENGITIALAGNPNSGKTTLFNSLTGSTAYVGNWPGVTVEKREGVYRNKRIGEARIVDLPGIYSLSPYSPEEVISRNYILQSHPDVVIDVIDATNLERNLYMTTQILEMDVPVVLALNMSDALEASGQSIDAKALGRKLGVPVVLVSALRERNLDNLMAEAFIASRKPRKGVSLWDQGPLKPIIEKAEAIYGKSLKENALFHAIKALEGDEIELKENNRECQEAQTLYEDKEGFEATSADERYKYIVSQLAPCRKGQTKSEAKKLTKSDKIDKVLTSKIWGIPIMLALLFIIFHVTFAGDLFYLKAMGVNFGDGYQGLIHFKVDGEEFYPFAGLFYDSDGIASIGEFFHRLFGDDGSGLFGCITQGIHVGLVGAGAPAWVDGIICSGICSGVFAVLGFVPQIMILFLFFAILEDSGYMARIAFMLDRIFRRFGVSGRAFIPMIMGFGCGIPAMINTRTLSSDKERTKTIRVIPFFACGAKATFLAVVADAVAHAAGMDGGLFTFSMYLLGIVVAIAAVIVMNKTSQREKVPPFVMELPAYHMPQPSALAIHVWDKGKHFIKKASTIILASTIIIWFLASFNWDWQMVDETGTSILNDLGKLIQPLFTPMGFGVQAGTNGWTLAVASIQGMVAKENVTSTVEALAAIIGADSFEAIIQSCGVSTGGVVAFAVFNLMTIPCFASVATAKAELPNRKSYVWTILFWLGLSYVLGCLTYITIDYVWTLGITLPLLGLGVLALYLYDRKKSGREAKAVA
ncbi:MAG: ferrous iron transporter B [Bacilli bacterium]|jgi:ferrous iron transport protein B|nr:ferrous iron transporter B [Bacilli bacterium]